MADNRRNFLKSSAALAAVGSTVPMNLATNAFAAADETLKIGLVGCGGRGTKAAKEALSSAGPVKLVAIGDVFRDQLDKSLERIEKATAKDDQAIVDVPEENKFVGFDAFKKVIDSDIDVLVTATPPGFRPMVFEYAVEKGKHCFLEKPVATDAPGVRKVMEAAKKAQEKNLKVGVGLQRRHRNSYLELLGKVADGEIGDVSHARVYWSNRGVWEPRKSREEVSTEMEYQMRNWYYYTWLCGDHITEQHIHNIDVGNWVMSLTSDGQYDHPVRARGIGGREVRDAPRYGEIFDHFACQFDYGDDRVVFSECRHIPNCWNSVTEHLYGTKGIMNLSDTGQNSVKRPGDEKPTRWRGKIDDAYQVEHDTLFAAIRSDTPYNEAEYGAKATMSAILGRMATYGGKEVTWEEAYNSDIQLVPNFEQLAWDADPPVLPDPNNDMRYPVAVPGVTKVV